MMGSLRMRCSAYASSIGEPSKRESWNIEPLLPFELWGIAIASIPRERASSSQSQRSSGSRLSNLLNGKSGASLPLKITLRWRFPRSSVDEVYS